MTTPLINQKYKRNAQVKLLYVTLTSLALVACGGGDPQDTPLVGTPHAVVKATKPTGGAAIALHLYQAFYGKAPGYALMTDYTAQATADAATFASSLASAFASTSHADLAKLVLDNLGVTATTVKAVNSKGESEYALLFAAVEQLFGAYPTMRGQVILNITNLLEGLEVDVTYGGVALAYNSQASTNQTYSTNPANTSSAVLSATGGVVSAWVVRSNPTGVTTKAPTHVVWTGSKFVGLEQSTDFHNAAAKFFSWTSADGITWTRNTTNMLSQFPNMTAANGLAFQLPGSYATSPFTINSSSDGITWVASTATYTGFAVPRGVKYLNDKYFISMDVDTCTVISSANASTWVSTDLRTLVLPTGYTKRLNTTFCSEPIYLEGKYLVYGGAIEFYVKGATSYLTQGLVYSSTDGTNWTASGFALPTGVNSIPQGGRSRTVLQIGDTVVIPLVQTETQVRLKPTDPYPTQVITNEQVGTSMDGLNFTYAPATGTANANTLAFYPSLPLPGGMLATTSVSKIVNFQSVRTYSYYYTTNGIAYTVAPDMKVGEGGYNVAPFAYSPTLKRLVFIKQETTSFAPSGVALSTYDFP